MILFNDFEINFINMITLFTDDQTINDRKQTKMTYNTSLHQILDNI